MYYMYIFVYFMFILVRKKVDSSSTKSDSNVKIVLYRQGEFYPMSIFQYKS